MTTSEPNSDSSRPSRSSWPRVFAAACNGIRFTFRTQRNLRVHLVVGVVVIGLAWLSQVSAVEWCCLLLCIGLMMTAELLNTAVEVIVDDLSPGWSEPAGRAKDVAAGAVLIAAVTSAAVGTVIFLPKLWTLVFNA